MSVLAAAVLAGAWLLAGYLYGSETAETVEAAAETDAPLSLAAGRRGELTALSWSWNGETVNLRRGDDGLWENADEPACPVDTGEAEALARSAAATTASLAIAGVTDMAQYGLDPAALTVVAATEDSIVTYEVGNMSITGEYYTRLDGGDTVYMENGALAAFRTTLADILALETIPEDIADVTGLTVTSGAENYELRREDGAEPGWYRVDGDDEAIRLETDGVAALYEPLLATELTDCVSWRAEEAPDFGMDEPQLTAEVTYLDDGGKKRSFTLEFGSYDDGDIFVSIDGSDLIYRIAALTADELMYPDWESLTPASVMTLDMTAVSSVTVGLGGRDYEILRLEEETETGTDVIYSCGGRILDAKQTESWLAALAGMTAERSLPPGEGRQTLLTATIFWKDEESVPAELELRNYDSSHCLCLVGGDRYLLIPRGEAEAVIAGGETLLNS